MICDINEDDHPTLIRFFGGSEPTVKNNVELNQYHLLKI